MKFVLKPYLGLAALAALASSAPASAGAIVLNVVRVTSTTDGIMIMAENGALPDDCAGSPWNWMLIPKAETAMISLFLTWYAQNKKSFTVYTAPRTAGYCTIVQMDPGS